MMQGLSFLGWILTSDVSLTPENCLLISGIPVRTWDEYLYLYSLLVDQLKGLIADAPTQLKNSSAKLDLILSYLVDSEI